ncbi:hypothetical protein J6590_002158 [Homalodisca vitripennis]|nr:hypothetical protein J6590_002158 [Homalodisca vitripennis]
MMNVRLENERELRYGTNVRLENERELRYGTNVRLENERELRYGTNVRLENERELRYGTNVRLENERELRYGTNVILENERELRYGTNVRVTGYDLCLPSFCSSLPWALAHVQRLRTTPGLWTLNTFIHLGHCCRSRRLMPATVANCINGTGYR